MSRHTSDAKSRASKKAIAIHAKLKAEIYREAERDADKQSRKRAKSAAFRARAES